MNAIDALIAGGLVDRLIDACVPGETYHAGDRGVSASNDNAPEQVGRIHSQLSAVAPSGSRLVMWMSRTSDGTRAMGEIVVDTGPDTPCIIWPIGEQGATRVDYGDQRAVTFSSASERLEVSSQPLLLLDMIDHPRAAETSAIVRQLGYRPVMRFPGELRISFRSVDLEQDRD